MSKGKPHRTDDPFGDPYYQWDCVLVRQPFVINAEVARRALETPFLADKKPVKKRKKGKK